MHNALRDNGLLLAASPDVSQSSSDLPWRSEASTLPLSSSLALQHDMHYQIDDSAWCLRAFPDRRLNQVQVVGHLTRLPSLAEICSPTRFDSLGGQGRSLLDSLVLRHIESRASSRDLLGW